VRDHNGQALSYVYYGNERGGGRVALARRGAAHGDQHRRAAGASALQLILNGIDHIGMRRGATSGAGRSVQIRAQAQERSVRRRVGPDTFRHALKVAPEAIRGSPAGYNAGRLPCCTKDQY
jgi:hypothetical protein